ncbi:G patch domain-containing protein 3-like isoform X2 [Gordionus sp. m RMFG-2023]|uniref:G patch domain-containing protein 3-like isoform X2 n=1 Tax=Gordionus sp. m RMFG-2023 TaxID=3053472 RepID=UPI0031FBD6DC
MTEYGYIDNRYEYLLIYNIPRQIRTPQLRLYFSNYIETNAFLCFHYKHRNNLVKNLTNTKNVCCCFIKLRLTFIAQFINDFHNHNWIDRYGNILDKRCQIMPINEKTMKNLSDDSIIKLQDISNLPEMNPPFIIPFGNVGTPTEYLYKKIEECKMPTQLISRLGLKFSVKDDYIKEYGNVGMTYKDNLKSHYTKESEICRNLKISLLDTFGNNLADTNIYPKKTLFHRKMAYSNNIYDSNSNNGNMDNKNSESEEEWDRHCSLRDDVDKQDRIKERLFETDKEITWEKGGSGLVWYTDAAYWDALEGKGNVFEERCPDDWDIDMSVYDNPNTSDKDARDLLSIRIKDNGGVDCWAPERYNLPPDYRFDKRKNYENRFPKTSKPKYIEETYESHKLIRNSILIP